MQQKRIFKLIVDGSRMLELYRQNLRMVPNDIQPMCQEMYVKMTDDIDVSDNENKKRMIGGEQSDFNSMLSKTKQQGRRTQSIGRLMFNCYSCLENILKLFRKDKLLSDNEFYHWVRNYQCTSNEIDVDETTTATSRRHPVSAVGDR
jgi:hypothetical protein